MKTTAVFVLLGLLATSGAVAQRGLRAKRIFLAPPTITITEVKEQPVSGTCTVPGGFLLRPAYNYEAAVSFTANKTDLSRYGLAYATRITGAFSGSAITVVGPVTGNTVTAFDGKDLKVPGVLTAQNCVQLPLAAPYHDEEYQLALYEKDASGQITSNTPIAVSNVSQPVRRINPGAATQAPAIRVYSTQSVITTANSCSYTSPAGPVVGTGLRVNVVLETINRGAPASVYFEEVLGVSRSGVSAGSLDSPLFSSAAQQTQYHNKAISLTTGLCDTFGGASQIVMTLQYRCYAANASGQKTGPVLYQTPAYSFTYNRPAGAARLSAERPAEPALIQAIPTTMQPVPLTGPATQLSPFFFR